MDNLLNISSLENLDFFARNLVEGFITGKHKSPFHGFSVEFAEHRIYNTGESTKHIDWKLYGRTDKLFVKKHEEETNLKCRIIIDNSTSMYYPNFNHATLKEPNKILYSVCASAALMNLFKKQRDAVGLSLFSEKINFHSQEKTSVKHHMLIKSKLIDCLKEDAINNSKKTFSVESLHQITERIGKRSLVLIFADLLDTRNNLSDIFSALHHFKYNQNEVILFYLKDKKTEIDLEFKNAPHKFIDVETKEELKLNPIELQEAYRKKSLRFINELKVGCLKYKIDLVEIDINEGFEQILISYLLKRKKMF